MAASSDHRKPLDIGRRQAVLALALLDGSRTNLDWTPSRKAAAVKQWHSRYNNGMVESPRPRRFQFRLLTLLIFVSLFCVICGWAFHQVHVVQERKTLLEQVIEHEGFYVTGSMHVRTGRKVRWSDLYTSLVPAAPTTVPLFRRWLGDEAIGVIGIPGGLPAFEELKTVFPEAAFSILTVKD